MNTRNHIFFFKTICLIVAFIFVCFCGFSQSLTSSPYSRYGFGELNLPTFASSSAMGNSFIAYHQDTVAPFFINSANPAGLAGLRLSALELGGQSQFTKISSNSSSIHKKNANFSYGSLGFPLKKISGGAAFGIMPYSSVGYKITSTEIIDNIGSMKYVFQGNGGITKVFVAGGFKPFSKQLSKFIHSDKADSIIKYGRSNKYKRIKFGRELLSELSFGAAGNYLFGTINQTSDVIYPSSTLYFNAKRQRIMQMNDFSYNVGLQTHFTIDSVKYHGKDSLKNGRRILLKDKIKIGAGFFASLPTIVTGKQSTILYNYSFNGLGAEEPKDTVLNSQNNKGNIVLPLEMGFGLSFKKAEKLTVLIDASTTNWKDFKYFGTQNSTFKNNYKLSAGLNYLPNKLAYGTSNYYKRIQYRLGFSYSDGFLDLKNTPIKTYVITTGLGLPVGIGRFDDVAVINISAQYGRIGTINNALLQEDYIRLILGFTFNKRWFIKYKYD